MVLAVARGVFTAVLLAAMLVLPAAALRGDGPATAPAPGGQGHVPAEGSCHGPVTAYWRVIRSQGANSDAAVHRAAKAVDHGCDVGQSPPADGPPWGKAGGLAKDAGDQGPGPDESDGVPHGWAWGQWKAFTPEQVAAACGRVEARLAGHEGRGNSGRAHAKVAAMLGCSFGSNK